MTDRLYTRKEAADALRITEDQLKRLVAARDVPHLRFNKNRVAFTDDHLAQIRTKFEVTPNTTPTGWGNRTRRNRRTA
jgi:hypothetical protein